MGLPSPTHSSGPCRPTLAQRACATSPAAAGVAPAGHHHLHRDHGDSVGRAARALWPPSVTTWRHVASRPSRRIPRLAADRMRRARPRRPLARLRVAVAIDDDRFPACVANCEHDDRPDGMTVGTITTVPEVIGHVFARWSSGRLAARRHRHSDDDRRPACPPCRCPAPPPARQPGCPARGRQAPRADGAVLPRLAAGGGPADAHEQLDPRWLSDPTTRSSTAGRGGPRGRGRVRRHRPRAAAPADDDVAQPVGQAGRVSSARIPAPRVLIANPTWSASGRIDTFRELERAGLTMYGQMTALLTTSRPRASCRAPTRRSPSWAASTRWLRGRWC
jgi:hypothetical protein